MPTPNLTQSSAVFADIQSKFTSSQWTAVLALVNSSETLKLQLTAFAGAISNGKAVPIDPGSVAAAAQFVQPANTGQSQITIGNSWYITPSQFVGVLAHEIGHYVNRFVDDTLWKQGVATGNPTEVQIACMSREGFAIANNIKISAEIQAAGGTGLVIPGQRPGDDLVAMATNQKQAYLSYGATEKEADAAINLWLSGYNGKNQPSNLANPETYAQWCLKEGARVIKKAPDTLNDYVYDPAAFDVTSTLSLDGRSTFTMAHGGTTDLTLTPNNLGRWDIAGALVLADSGAPVDNTHLDLTNNISSTGAPAWSDTDDADGTINLILADGYLTVLFTGASTDGPHNIAGAIAANGWMPGAEDLSPISFAAEILNPASSF